MKNHVYFQNKHLKNFLFLGSTFQRLIKEKGPASENAEGVKKVIFCTGKVYYDLIKARRDAGRTSAFSQTQVTHSSLGHFWKPKSGPYLVKLAKSTTKSFLLICLFFFYRSWKRNCYCNRWTDLSLPLRFSNGRMQQVPWCRIGLVPWGTQKSRCMDLCPT